MKRNLILTIVILICVLGFSSVSHGQDEDFWIANFEYVETGMNATGTRSYVIFYNLKIRKENGKITGLYQSGENSSPYKNVLLTVEIEGNTALFYYDRCLENEEWDDEPCKNYDKKGDLMFKLVKSIGKNRKTIILTYGVKNELLPKGKVFFKRVESFQMDAFGKDEKIKQASTASQTADPYLKNTNTGNISLSEEENAEAVVASLYKAGNAKHVGEMSSRELKRFFSDRIAGEILKAGERENGLNFDVLYYAQDTQIKNFKIGKAVQDTRTSVTVTVSFTNFGQKEQFKFTLGSYAEDWRIDEITYTDGTTFSEILSSDY